jgi:H+/Cl- antiporter ClcA
VVTLLAGFMMAARLFTRLKAPAIAKSALGGVIFGIVGVALPLTMSSGSDQLKSVLHDAGTLGLGLLAAILIAKMLTFAVSQGSGFVGGPIFPSLFIGGTAGVIVHQAIPSVPPGLAFTCLLAAVPGAPAPAPFSMGADGRVLDPGGGAADRTHPDRRHHRFPHDGSRQVPH